MSSFCGIHSWNYPIGVATTATPSARGRTTRPALLSGVVYNAICVPLSDAQKSCVATQNGIGSWKKDFAQCGPTEPYCVVTELVMRPPACGPKTKRESRLRTDS